MPDSSEHRSTVSDAFTKQADAYAANTTVSDPQRVNRLVKIADPSPDASVLEVATGPGYVTLGFASGCKEVVGVDLTREPLLIAERNRRERGVTNAQFLRGDADYLPIVDEGFDIVVCRFAFHHLKDPGEALLEMVRVCDPDGTIVVEDLVVSEHPRRARYQNRLERLRDPSHVRAYPLSELLGLFTGAGIELRDTHTDTIIQEVEEWLDNAQTPDEEAAEVRSMIEADVEADRSGARPFWSDDTLYIAQPTATVSGRPIEK